MDRVMEANKLYNSLPTHDRDDAMAMQYLIPNWKFDSKKPALVRKSRIGIETAGTACSGLCRF